jgi:hypothetical protein
MYLYFSQECGSYHGQLVGFGPPKTTFGDIIAILYGCSVPVILQPMLSESGKPHGYHFVGEAYIYGKMDGEAFEDHRQTKTFKLFRTLFSLSGARRLQASHSPASSSIAPCLARSPTSHTLDVTFHIYLVSSKRQASGARGTTNISSYSWSSVIP